MSVLVHAGPLDLEESSEKHGSKSPATSDSVPWPSSSSQHPVAEEPANNPATHYESQEKAPITPPSSYLSFLKQLPISQSPIPSPATDYSKRSSSEEEESLTPAQSRRKARNRAAQRAFREQKERRVKELEPKLNNLEAHSSAILTDSERVIPSPYSPAEWSMDDKTRSYHSPRSVHDQPVSVRQVVTRTVTYARTKGTAEEKVNPDLTEEPETIDNPVALYNMQDPPALAVGNAYVSSLDDLTVKNHGKITGSGVPIANVTEGHSKEMASTAFDEDGRVWDGSDKEIGRYKLIPDKQQETMVEGCSMDKKNLVVIKKRLENLPLDPRLHPKAPQLSKKIEKKKKVEERVNEVTDTSDSESESEHAISDSSDNETNITAPSSKCSSRQSRDSHWPAHRKHERRQAPPPLSPKESTKKTAKKGLQVLDDEEYLVIPASKIIRGNQSELRRHRSQKPAKRLIIYSSGVNNIYNDYHEQDRLALLGVIRRDSLMLPRQISEITSYRGDRFDMPYKRERERERDYGDRAYDRGPDALQEVEELIYREKMDRLHNMRPPPSRRHGNSYGQAQGLRDSLPELRHQFRAEDPQESEPYDSSVNHEVGLSTRESVEPEEAASISLTVRSVPQPKKFQRVMVQLADGRMNRRKGKIVSFLLRSFGLLGLELTVPESFTNGNASRALELSIESSFYVMAYYGLLSSVPIALTLISNIVFFITPELRYDHRLYRYLDKCYRLLATVSTWGILGNGEEGGEVLERVKMKERTGYVNEVRKPLLFYSVIWWALNVFMTVGPMITSSLQHLTLRESKLEEDKVRVRYRCRCGKKIFGDYQELRPGAAAEWQERLNKHFEEKRNTSNSAESSGRSGKISNILKSVFDFLTLKGRENTSSDASALPLTSNPSTPNPSQSPISQAPTSLKFLLLCIRHEKWAIKLKHANACSITSDVQLFRILASEYRAARRRSLLSMRKLGSIKFLRFEALQKAETIGVRKVPDYPPEDNTDYDYKPRPLDLLPPISENEMMHLFLCPDHALDKPLFLERMPLKLYGRLDLSSGANTGWGIIFNDSISWKKVWMMAFIGMLSSALAGLSWWFIKDDAQGGSVIAGVTAPIILVTIGAIQGYLGEID